MATHFDFLFPKGDERPTLHQRFAALRYIRPLVKLVWQTHRGYTTAMAVLRLLRAAVPVATLWIAKLIIDAVVASRDSSPDYPRLWRLVALEIVIVTAGDIL